MSYNGSGTFLINSAGQPVVSGTVISSTAFNALTADLATGLSTAITKDGQTTPTANIPMGNNKITGLAVGTAATDAATLSQAQSTAAKLITASGADTVTGTLSPTLAAYATGQMFYWVAAGDNTGAVTLNIDSLGAKAVTRDGTTALSAGDIQSGEVCVVVYDGTRFQLINGASQSASITTENLTVNKATVLNESGGDNDTRIEGDTDANLVFVDASTDRVGVGTSTPDAKFTVNGVGAFGDGAAATPSIANTGDLNTGFWFPADDTIAASTAGSERLRLDASGNLGLGVTPNAWSTSGVLQLPSGGNISASTGIGLNANAYFNSGWKYIASSNASQYVQSGGSHLWYTAPSGTAGNAITFTQAMTLDASGNLGVGTSLPACRLHVDGQEVRLNASSGAFYSLYTAGTRDFYAEASAGAVNLIGTTNKPMIFGTNNAERARITAAGGLAVGTTTDPGAGNIGLAAGKNLQYSSTAYITPEDNVSGARISSPGVISFWTGVTPAERARITDTGSIVAGGSVALATTATDGFLYVPTCAGTPTGTPTSITGMAPIVVNTTNNKLYFYSGGQWRDAGP
jgi:hypothetical protein